MTNSIDELEDELNDLDVPMVGVDAILMVAGDAFDVDPLDVLNAWSDADKMRDLQVKHGGLGVSLMTDLIDEGIESSTQIPHIIRAIELNREINNS